MGDPRYSWVKMEKRRMSLDVVGGRWMVVVASIYVMSCAGATYMFGIYSDSIKQALHYDQTTVTTLSFFKDLGANVGIVAGLLKEVAPTWVVLAVGAASNLCGYLMIWLAVTQRIARPPKWHMYLFMCVGANSQSFTTTAALVTCVNNFPYSRGVVLGLLKGFVGLSGAIFTQIYHALYGQDSTGVILLVAWLPSLVSLLFMFVVRPMKPELLNKDKHFFSFLYLALALAGFLFVVIVLENQVHMPAAMFKVIALITVLLVVANLWIGVRAELERPKPHVEHDALPMSERKDVGISAEQAVVSEGKLEVHGKDTDQPAQFHKESEKAATHAQYGSPHSAPCVHTHPHVSLQAQQTGHHNQNFDKQTNKTALQINRETLPPQRPNQRIAAWARSVFSGWPERGDDFTIPQALLSLDMWILFISLTCGVGATLTAIDNMGQIGASLGYSSLSISTFVSLISIWNFLGRVISGFLSEILLQRYRFPRTLVLTIVLGLACLGHLLIAFPFSGSVYVASIVVGLCFGAQWPLLSAVISELFGLKYFATLSNCGAIASPLGSYLLNVRVAGYLYDKEARKQQDAMLFSSEGVAPSPLANNMQRTYDTNCVGVQCFRMTFLIMTVVSLSASIFSALLVLRTRKFYSQDIYANFRKANAVKEDMAEPL